MDNGYILITSAYNEEDYIGKTIDCVLKQSILPKAWYIISDCSSDSTDEIIRARSQNHDFIVYMRRNDKDKERHNFASKVFALNSVLEIIDFNNYSYLGILDADIILPNNYYEVLIEKLKNNKKLGLVGGSIFETINGKEVLHDVSLNTVSGAVQFFRMECFRQLGNFYPMPYGGEDSMMGVKAGFNGWDVKTFTELKTYEQKFVGRSKKTFAEARYHRGKVFYDMGYHPVFMIAKCLFRTFNKPIIIGSVAEMFGYLFSCIKRRKRIIPKELVSYLRKQQIERLLSLKSYR